MEAFVLLDSAQHKLRLARYHADALLNVLQLHPSEDLDDPRRIEMEAHLEGLAYTGTAAAEKMLRSLDPTGMRGQMSVEQMIRHLVRDDASEHVQGFARRFESWWLDRGRGLGPVARDLRNDAAHRVYEKAPDGPAWRMQITGRSRPILLEDFARDYGSQLEGLGELVTGAERGVTTSSGQ
jgi:hypothetical protein